MGFLSGVKRGLEIMYGLILWWCLRLWIVPTWMIVQFFRDHRAAGRFTNGALKILFFLIGCQVRVMGKRVYGDAGRENLRVEPYELF